MHDEKLAEVLCETAELMFFQEFQESPNFSAPQSVFWATIAIRSPGEFEVIVAADETEVREIMNVMFPTEEKLSDDRVADVVAELANTIAGCLARHISDESELDLSPPGKGLGSLPKAEKYHAFAGNDITLMVAVRDLNTKSQASVSIPPEAF